MPRAAPRQMETELSLGKCLVRLQQNERKNGEKMAGTAEEFTSACHQRTVDRPSNVLGRAKAQQNIECILY